MVKDKRGYNKLALYNKSKELVLLAYKITNKYPKTEMYTLVPQIRRSAVSVVSNIVEGYTRETSAEFARFLTISIGSVTELGVQIEISGDLGFINKANLNRTLSIIEEVKRLLYGTRKAIRRR